MLSKVSKLRVIKMHTARMLYILGEEETCTVGCRGIFSSQQHFINVVDFTFSTVAVYMYFTVIIFLGPERSLTRGWPGRVSSLVQIQPVRMMHGQRGSTTKCNIPNLQ
jgi:hypothetical protein